MSRPEGGRFYWLVLPARSDGDQPGSAAHSLGREASEGTRNTGLVFRNVSRDDFDAWLLSLLPENVEVVSQTRLAAVESNGEGVVVKIASRGAEKQIYARFLIGAGGALSRV